MDTVADLIRALQQMPQGAKPVISADHYGVATIYSVHEAEVLKGDPDMEPLHPNDIANGEYGDNPETVTHVFLVG